MFHEIKKMNKDSFLQVFRPLPSPESTVLSPLVLKTANPFFSSGASRSLWRVLPGAAKKLAKGFHLASLLRLHRRNRTVLGPLFRSPRAFLAGIKGKRKELFLALVQKLLSFAILFHGWYLGFIVLLCGLFLVLNPAVTGIMVTRSFFDGHQVQPTVFIPRSSIPRSLQRGFIRLEDHQFYQHPGISLGAIREAMQRNAKLGGMVFGGSTITQQTARTIFLNSDRNVLRKYLELLAVFPMEWILGKDRILELYLNYIEFGKGAFGLGRGALYQYGRPFSKLSAEERIRLAVIITSPIRYNVRNYYKQAGMVARYRALTQ